MKMNHIKENHGFKVSGFSLLEVLVAVVVFSVGILGVASLMLVSMRANDAALTRTQSTMLANEMFEKMLANIKGVKDGDYNLDINSSLPMTASLECDLEDCPTTTDLAAWDLAEWGLRANRILPGADAAISVTDSDVTDPNSIIDITIELQFQPLAEDSSSGEIFTFRTR